MGTSRRDAADDIGFVEQEFGDFRRCGSARTARRFQVRSISPPK